MAPTPQRIPAGFDEAFDALFATAFRVARRLLPSDAAAEDAAAETLTRAYVRWRKIGSADWREGWIVRVATNVAIDAVRKQSRTGNDPVPEVGATDPDTTQRLTLARALASLPRRQREVMVLRYLEGYPVQDVAEALGISSGSVKTHTSRGLDALRKELGPDAAVWAEQPTEEGDARG